MPIPDTDQTLTGSTQNVDHQRDSSAMKLTPATRVPVVVALCVLIGVMNTISGQLILNMLGFAGFDTPLTASLKVGAVGGLSYGFYLSIVFYSPAFFTRVLLFPNVLVRYLAYAVLGAAASAAGVTTLSGRIGVAGDITRAACAGTVGAPVIMPLVVSTALKLLGSPEVHERKHDEGHGQQAEHEVTEEKGE